MRWGAHPERRSGRDRRDAWQRNHAHKEARWSSLGLAIVLVSAAFGTLLWAAAIYVAITLIG